MAGMSDTDKDVQVLERHFIDLSRAAYQRDRITFSDFLDLNEQNILHKLPKDRLYTRVVSFGGFPLAERQMAAFIPDALSLRWGKEELDPAEAGYPFSVLQISPINPRFAEELSHRDFLGALLNLGIERSRIGDIICRGAEASVFVHNDMKELVAGELTRVRHTSVKVTETVLTDFHYTPEYDEIRGTVASVRLDSLLALAFSSSRSKLSGLIEGGKVFVNGRLVTSNGYEPKEGDIVSVRGMGKFRFAGEGTRTRKNRLSVTVLRYK